MAKKAGKAHILPRIITGGDFLSLCLSHWERGKTPYTELKPLDRISFLHEAVIRVAKNLPESAVLRRLVEIAENELVDSNKERKIKSKNLENSNSFKNSQSSQNSNNQENQEKHQSKKHQNIHYIEPNEDEGMYSHEAVDAKSLSMAKFFPWAHSLDALFEECFQQLVDVIDIVHAEGEVSAFAAALLSALRSIHSEYINLLGMDTLAGRQESHTQAHNGVNGVSGTNKEENSPKDLNDATAQLENQTHKPHRASTPAFSAYRAAQFVEAYHEHFRIKEKGLAFELGEKRLDAISVTSWSEEERNVFFDDFMPEVFKDRIIIFAGFVRLTEAEDTLYKYFWKNGANIVWHSDPALCDGADTGTATHMSANNVGSDPHENKSETETEAESKNKSGTSTALSNVHYSCADHVEWLQRWNTHCTLLCESSEKKPHMHFYAAYDAHSQVQALKADLEECVETLLQNMGMPEKAQNEKSQNTNRQNEKSEKVGKSSTSNLYNSASDDTLAVLLPKPSLLMPVLHELPEKDINISMGYPVNRTLLGQFVELIIRLQENKQIKPKGEIYVSAMNKHGQMKEQGQTQALNQTHSVNEIDTDNTGAENTSENRAWYVWKDILSLLRHPYARMLVPYDSSLVFDSTLDENIILGEDGVNGKGVNAENSIDMETAEKEKTVWRSLLYILEKSLREGNASLNIDDFLDEILGDIDNENLTKNFAKNSPPNLSQKLPQNFIVSEDLERFITEFFEHSVGVWEQINSLYDVAQALENFADFLLKHGSVLWQSFPLDAEALVRCIEKIVPSLCDNNLAHDYLPQEALFTVLRQLFVEERIPFEADPLSGMQILGMLESRLLRFRKIFIMDMTEDNLPGIIQQDPLLPDSLRNLLSLPDTHKREILMAHTFYRLIAGAEDVWLYWQEGIQASEVQSSKSLRSRFVEECLWEEEKKKGQIVQNGDGFLRSADCRPNAPLRQLKKEIACTETIKNRLRLFFEKPISSSALDTYIHCPAKFFYTYLGGLGEIEEVNEGDDYRELGIWLHELLQDTYKNSMGEVFEHNQENLNALLSLFHERLNSPSVAKFISPESYFMLARAGEHHLRNYWKSMPYSITLMSLENKYECDVPSPLFASNALGISQIRLQGRFDRVDIRVTGTPTSGMKNASSEEQLIAHVNSSNVSGNLSENFSTAESFSAASSEETEHWILDYKTGKGQKLNKKIWENTVLWNGIKDANHTKSQSKRGDILQEISQLMPNIQLPFYLYVYGANFPEVLCNAAWIFLGEEKKEIPLVEIPAVKTSFAKNSNGEIAYEENKVSKTASKKTNTDDSDAESKLASWNLLQAIKTEFMPELLEFSLNHLLEAKSFKAIEGKACTYCPHKDYC